MKKSEKLFNAVTEIDDKYIEEASGTEPKKKARLIPWICAAAAGIVCVGIIFSAVNIGKISHSSSGAYATDTAAETEETDVTVSAAGLNSEDYEYETAESYDGGTYYDGTSEESGTYADSETDSADSNYISRKLITTVSLDLETLYFDETIDELMSRTETSGGYIEQSYIYNGSSFSDSEMQRQADLTCRIPEETLDDFTNSVSELYNVTGKSTDVEDITLTYTDTESRKKTLETEENTLIGLMEKAEKVEDVIAIEEQLTEVRYQIESIESRLRSYDNKINYSTVYISISEVDELTDVTKAENLGEEISKGFKNSAKNIAKGAVTFAVKTLMYLPYIACAAAAAGIIVLIIKKTRKKKNKPE